MYIFENNIWCFEFPPMRVPDVLRSVLETFWKLFKFFLFFGGSWNNSSSNLMITQGRRNKLTEKCKQKCTRNFCQLSFFYERLFWLFKIFFYSWGKIWHRFSALQLLPKNQSSNEKKYLFGLFLDLSTSAGISFEQINPTVLPFYKLCKESEEAAEQ